MSFMFKPLAYDDLNARNVIARDLGISDDIVTGNTQAGKRIVEEINKKLQDNKKVNVLVDGYVSANFELIKNLIGQYLKKEFTIIDTRGLFKDSTVLDKELEKYLPEKSVEDPVQLFGKLFDGKFVDLFVQDKLEEAIKTLRNNDSGIVVVIGNGACSESFIDEGDLTVYLDVTPKTTAIRALKGCFANFGDIAAKPFNLLMRRNYYIDFELTVEIRKNLLQADSIDLYICADNDESYLLLGRKAFNGLLNEMAKRPYRCKPVYLEGIWGGEYIKKIRNIPTESNIAWIFELIPMEVSMLIEYMGQDIEIPYASFFQKLPLKIMGKACTEQYKGYFPVRCNYDDTYHSDGNMSIQIHPGRDFSMENYHEHGGQDEAYYVIATATDARTYIGMKDSTDIDEFFQLTAASEKDGSVVDYKKYINSVVSIPGIQLMLPAGTIHSSGQNQFILELGSLTIGSYTYKIYDYNRRDGEGNVRPIHTINAKKVLNRDLTEAKVKEKLVREPAEVASGDGWKLSLLGRTEEMYYETYALDIATGKEAILKKADEFVLLCMVDGEHATIMDNMDQQQCYKQNYLDIVVVPAAIAEYRIVNTGYQPLRLHMTRLKDKKS